MTAGQQLRKALGLADMPYARINRAIGTSIKILFVWYDSYRKNMPITTTRLRKFPHTATMFIGMYLLDDKKPHPMFTPAVDLDDYNGEIRSAVIIPVNLAGDRFMQPSQFSRVLEQREKEQKDKTIPLMLLSHPLIREFVTLADLADASAMSGFTDTWRKDRNRVMGAENITAKLIDCFIDESDKSVTFAFLTESTELGTKEPNPNIDSPYRFYSSPKGETDPENDFDVSRNRSRTYEVQIKILDFFDWLKTHPEEKDITTKDMKEILEVSNVQVFSNSPSFHWQGMNYNLSQIDASIYPTDIPNPEWGPRHGDASGYFVDKHLGGLLRQMQFFLNPMSSMLTKKLRDNRVI